MKARAGNTAWECAEYHHPDPSSMLRERGVQQSDPGPPDEVMRGHCVSLYFLAVSEGTRTGRQIGPDELLILNVLWLERSITAEQAAQMAHYRLTLPPELMVEFLTSSCSRPSIRIIINIPESRTLAALRDALLPKLIRGEYG